MRIFALTKLGEQVAVRTRGNSDELRILRYMYSNRSQPVSEDELNQLGEDSKYIIKKLRRQSLITELTSG